MRLKSARYNLIIETVDVCITSKQEIRTWRCSKVMHFSFLECERRWPKKPREKRGVIDVVRETDGCGAPGKTRLGKFSRGRLRQNKRSRICYRTATAGSFVHVTRSQIENKLKRGARRRRFRCEVNARVFLVGAAWRRGSLHFCAG